MKIKKDILPENLPSKNRYYFSEQPIAELFILIDEELEFRITRCDCDKYRRCAECRIESKIRFMKEKLKNRISEVFE